MVVPGSLLGCTRHLDSSAASGRKLECRSNGRRSNPSLYCAPVRGSWLGSLLLGIGVAACNAPSARQGDAAAVDGGADASVAAAAPAEPRVLDRSRPEERSLAPPAQDRWQLAMGHGE